MPLPRVRIDRRSTDAPFAPRQRSPERSRRGRLERVSATGNPLDRRGVLPPDALAPVRRISHATRLRRNSRLAGGYGLGTVARAESTT